MRLFITGATGFIGKRLVDMALARSYSVTEVVRSHKLSSYLSQLNPMQEERSCVAGDLTRDYDWSASLENIDCVIHCAARVHQMDETGDVQALYDETNFHATINLAKQAAQQGVKRFVFLSSIKVNGETTEQGKPFLSTLDSPPTDPYGLSKYKAEKALLALAQQTSMEVVIIRPPLVYGADVKANFATMLKWATKTVILPFGAIKNKRSMVFIDNLVDLILLCSSHPNAAGQIFLVSDANDVSTSQLLQQIKHSSRSHCILFPLPMCFFRWGAYLIGKPHLYQKLCGSLQVDISETKKQLNWSPMVNWEEAIAQTVNHYLQSINDKLQSTKR